ncbi:MBL fold metallo-hydrolase [Clostridium tagluense]|uniref:MBL fold metallo-hydrolase n=1 Tax=Clostridium tagluense TaxID=360422 RepID=UPI001C0C2E74|nr:MBL fold metallo-hydrolase [Clostridium tagluense]MBU3127767.1 MBL fold metallo-hydrolase [Clostridium tagluense]MBW9157456.1 MBL fold metallo-hydrolase [Clostridium tagluense]MCB2310209.1 MBL fold metallo-hydrolase [Clostridium tagluense]MCB2315149.1 MBL fold metallo-hydrolase [Clostridium tagluense]MCB2319909.1 MBL fold metallo-hydrolase [Clostridium tagluense]
MEKIKAKIYYIYHSGFAIKTENHFLIFDYYKEPIENDDTHKPSVLLSSENIKQMKNMVVFASHSHEDHFNSSILEWENYNSNIKYIFSSDITINKNKPSYNFIEEGEERTFDDLYVKAYGSTDIGISFLVKVDGLTIFHAGDLNLWRWKEDSLEEQSLAESSFKAHIDKLSEEKSIDIAFFPVDPRLQEAYYVGGEYFAKKIQPKLLIPMHFGEEVNITSKFADKMRKQNINAVQIDYSGQEIIY